MSRSSLSVNTQHPRGTPVNWWIAASSGHESHNLPSVWVQLGIGRPRRPLRLQGPEREALDPELPTTDPRPWGAQFPGMPVSSPSRPPLISFGDTSL